MHYVKLFDGLLRSSIVEMPVETRWLWVVLLASADQDGNVYGTPSALARLANMPLDVTERALAELEAPDPSSSTPDEDGRRILRVGGNSWFLINYAKYRQIKDADGEREKARLRLRKFREKQKGAKADDAGAEMKRHETRETPGNAGKRKVEVEEEEEEEERIGGSGGEGAGCSDVEEPADRYAAAGDSPETNRAGKKGRALAAYLAETDDAGAEMVGADRAVARPGVAAWLPLRRPGNAYPQRYVALTVERLEELKARFPDADVHKAIFGPFYGICDYLGRCANARLYVPGKRGIWRYVDSYLARKQEQAENTKQIAKIRFGRRSEASGEMSAHAVMEPERRDHDRWIEIVQVHGEDPLFEEFRCAIRNHEATLDGWDAWIEAKRQAELQKPPADVSEYEAYKEAVRASVFQHRAGCKRPGTFAEWQAERKRSGVA